MNTHFPIKCDVCGELMLLRWVVTRNQSYECPSCADRWAIVWINSSGGINTVRHTDRADAAGKHKAIVAGAAIGPLLGALFGRKKS